MLTCERAQRSLSAMADGEAPETTTGEVDAHVAGCADCRGFEAHLRTIRQNLRFEQVGDLPDLAPAVLARLGERVAPHHRWRAVAVAAAVGVIAGAIFADVDRGPTPVAAADLPRRVVDEQPAVTTLSASLTIETGDDTWTGTLRYRAPESLAVVLHDRDGTLLATVADADRWWVSGPRRCVPPTGSSTCAAPTLRAVEGRAPFADDAPIPLELVVPVDALSRSALPEPLGTGDGTVGIRVTAGQVAGLLDGLDPTGTLRPVHPSDPVDLWLDAADLIPVEVVVRAGASPERARWAAALGLDDDAGDTVLRIRLGDLAVDGDLPADAFPPPPSGADTRDGGFVEGEPDPAVAPVPSDLPAGLEPGRSGTVGKVAVRTWSDGRAWLAVRGTRSWPGDRLFGGLGDIVVPVDLGAAGLGYASGDDTRLAVHADGVDVVVTGSVGREALRRVAASLGLLGRAVPPDWAEAATATLAEAVAAAPDLLVAGPLDGFGEPAVSVDGDHVVVQYTGAGDRSFLLVRSGADELPPPLDAEVTAVAVRGQPGRWLPATGDLEWVEGGHVRALRSATLELGELLAIAEGLRSA